MMIKVIAWFIFLIGPLCAVELKLEHARTEEQLLWGLMQRTELPKNHGMLFHYSKEDYVSVWMFNCLKDLSAAFLNSKGVILEIFELKAYPEQMDAKRPVRSTKDFAKYPSFDSIYQFFITRAVRSSQPVRYLLEMDAGWFEKNDVHPGDKLIWDQKTAHIERNR